MSRACLVPILLLLACGSQKFPAPDAVYAEALARFDGDGSGTLSREEYDRFDPLPDTFDKMDSGKDGAVNVEEFKYFVLANQPRALVARTGPADQRP